ncbi:unnamed protein product [Paramecium sonneborni]|uniref:Uncharacterized protein n=1 Tax=Paramecium sonneborni TaxID=65129 RepID=A0A8S1MCX5_9CILI|nr:unnamed protein product [Paramecium sonneborni]
MKQILILSEKLLNLLVKLLLYMIKHFQSKNYLIRQSYFNQQNLQKMFNRLLNLCKNYSFKCKFYIEKIEILIKLMIVQNSYQINDSLKIIFNILDYANEPEAKCMLIEDRLVQLQLLTSGVKLYIKYPSLCSALIQQLINSAKDSFNPDVRDRTYIYWRLLSTDPEAVRNLVFYSMTDSSQFQKDIRLWETKDLIVALEYMCSISNLFHKLPNQLYKNIKVRNNHQQETKLYKVEDQSDLLQKEYQHEQNIKKDDQNQPQQKTQDIDLLSFEDSVFNQNNNKSNINNRLDVYDLI